MAERFPVGDEEARIESGLASLVNDTFLRRVVHLREVDSTNSHAIGLLAAKASIDTPSLVYAESQHAGRGRGMNQWWSAAGSLTFSIVVDLQKLGFSDAQKPLLPLLTGLAIRRTGCAMLPSADFKIKWPNDVYVADKKLAGILIEVPSHSLDHAVIGVGLNVNNRFANAPDSLASIGTSLADQSGASHDRVLVLRSFLQELDAVFQTFASGENVLSDWSSYCLLTGKQVTLQTGSTQAMGLCHGINATGALVLETSNGRQPFVGGVVQSWG